MLRRSVVEPTQFDEGFSVVVDPHVEMPVGLGALDDHRRQLPSALVAAGRLARVLAWTSR